MATAPREASPTSTFAVSDPPLPSGFEPATVEESPEELDLIGILRQTVLAGSQPIDAILASLADAARALSGADGTALAVETKGAIICRARSGTIAPGLGAPISADSGISGECLRSAAMLVCHDTLSDSRVDAEVCRALGIRSIAAVPLLEGSQGVGILEAFSAKSNAFDGEALNSLRSLAEIAQVAYHRESHPPIENNPLAPIRQALKYVPRSFTAEELATPASRFRKAHIQRGVLIAVAVLLTSAVAWWSWHSPDEGTGSSQTAHAATAVATVTAQPVVRETLPKPTPGVSGKHSESHPDVGVRNAAEVQPVPDNSSEPASLTPAPEPTQPARASAPEPTVIEAPAVSLAGSSNPEQLSQLTSVQAQLPAGGPVVSQGVVEPVLVHKVDAGYPMQARTQRLSGKVTLTATIAADGSIRNLTVVSGSPILAAAAQNAVRQWRYRPATLNGTPIDVQKQITFVFEQP